MFLSVCSGDVRVQPKERHYWMGKRVVTTQTGNRNRVSPMAGAYVPLCHRRPSPSILFPYPNFKYWNIALLKSPTNTAAIKTQISMQKVIFTAMFTSHHTLQLTGNEPYFIHSISERVHPTNN